jgi:hypothetical protein
MRMLIEAVTDRIEFEETALYPLLARTGSARQE